MLGEFVAEAHPVVVNTKANNHAPTFPFLSGSIHEGFLFERYRQFVVVVHDVGRFTPHRFPRFIERGSFGVGKSEPVHQVGFIHSTRSMFILSQLESQPRRQHHGLLLVKYFIDGHAPFSNLKVQCHVAVWRLHALGQGKQWYESCSN